MASQNKSAMGGFVENYTQLNTIPALVGILFAVSSGVQFLGMTISIQHPIAYSFPSEHAMIVSLLALIVAFAASDTRSYEFYETWEQLTVVVAVAAMISSQYIAEVQTIVANNQPWTGTALFAVSVVAWAILSR